MSLSGAIRENTRRNESLDRGTVSVTGSATVTVTGRPGPIRQVTRAVAWLESTSAPADTIITVGNYSNNTFTVYAWKMTGLAGAAVPAPVAVTVGASPFAYTVVNTGALVIDPGAATISDVTINRGAYTSGTLGDVLAGAVIPVVAGDVVTVTYAVDTPLMEELPFPVASTTLIAATDTITCGWMAWGNLSAGQGF